MKNIKYYIPFFIIVFICFILPTEAIAQTDDEYYKNKNGVIFSKKEYDFFSKLGYGSVFSFSQTSKSYYDGMNGVDIAV